MAIPVIFKVMALLPAMVAMSTAHPAESDESLEQLEEIVVTAREPRYVAPTTRDRIGRVWVPVFLDGHGPFRMVLDTGAQRSAVIESVATRLGRQLDGAPRVRLHGATGTSIAPTIDVETLTVGDLWLQSERLPIVADAFGGAEGLLGMDGMQERRIYIDFRADYVDITRSHNRRAANNFITLPFLSEPGGLLKVDAEVGGVKVIAVIDTGAQATVGNEALRAALRRRVSSRSRAPRDEIHGATGDIQTGIGASISPFRLGGLEVNGAHITFGDLYIFELWELTDRPAILVGMDILGLVDTLVVDYGRREVHIKP